MTKKSKIILGSFGGGVALAISIPLAAYGIQQAAYQNRVSQITKNYSNDLIKLDEAKKAKEAAYLKTVEGAKKLFDETNARNKRAQSNPRYTPEYKAKTLKAFEEAKANFEDAKANEEKYSKEYELAKKKAEEQTEKVNAAQEFVAKNGNGNKDSKVFTVVADYIARIKLEAKENKATELADINEHYPSAEDVEKISKYYDKYIHALNSIKRENLTDVTLAWADGLAYDWEILKNNYTSGGRYFWTTYFWGTGNAYPANSFDNTLKNAAAYSTSALRNLKEAVEHKITLSKVVIKNNVKNILENHYVNQLKEFSKGTEEEISVKDLINKSSLSTKVKELHVYYATEYYNASDHGFGENLAELKLFKTNKFDEKENIIEIEGKKIYGLGFTQKDLNAENVGFAGIQGDKDNPGAKPYDAILKMSTTSDDTPDEVYKSGYKTTKEAAKNIKLVAKKVAELIAGADGEWKAKFKYDEDGMGEKDIKELELIIRKENGDIDLSNFFKWLNQEQFFFGREDSSYYTEEKKKELEKAEEVIKHLKQQGYEELKNSDEKYGSITKKQFYYGALEAFKNYQQFIDQTKEHGLSFFAEQVPSYKLQIHRFNRRFEDGIGAYNGGYAAFIFNCDPYFSGPKWSVTSFANHEGIMGHHNQIYYARKFLAKQDGRTLGNIFDYTSYAEGWALFMEWFGIESGWYGTPDYENEDYYAAPIDFSTSKGITSFVNVKETEKVTSEMINKIKELHGGVYWNLVESGLVKSKDDKEHALRATKLANMLQYFGALNDGQLRNMRRAIDTAYHGSSVNGESDLKKGASINQVRQFMKANSALGIGDIEAESRRYLNLPGQATAYNAGKEIMLRLYDKVRKHHKISRKAFVQSIKTIKKIDGTILENAEHGYIKEFFDILLKNGGLPMGTLEKVVAKAFNLK
ncbi:DUF885 family protein [Metamycoplasma equirhinis]|uniref:DUF885 family protein n=1 Tax=Metamycoplasma equirhinis TaxID=92402 RepID=UPI0035939DD6